MPDEQELIQQRIAKLEAIRAQGVNPFGGRFDGTEPAASLKEHFEEGRRVRAAGRMMTRRDMGKSAFAHIRDGSGTIQVFLQKDALGDEAHARFKSLVDLGDFIGVDGTLFTTKTGERSIRAESFTILAKAIRPLPDKWHGLTDHELRYRQRYLDLATNEDVRSVFLARIRAVREIRAFFESRGFLEVETPMMQPIPGGAAATPFVTHHNALDIDLYLRIAPELYLKRLLVGGFERVFEINRNFRNEGLSRKHNPEFTMLEAYWAYADFELMADLMEELIAGLAASLAYSGPIDWSRPWPRVRYHDAIRKAAGDDWFDLTPAGRKDRAAELGVEIMPELVDFEVTNQIFEKLVEAKTISPVFYTHLPHQLVPLAKQNPDDPSLVDVFELVANGQELAPGYSELNDPIAQRERLLHQSGGEPQRIDDDFLTALEHGMPPAGGIGLGIDRLVMTLTGAESIRDVIFFPLLKPGA
ncbi:MAG: lysine--tRNA ligase [Verrucomicrobiae bacterium]|nr:lysine--tRNA ligase [Verrucomicrobiae bacterium]